MKKITLVLLFIVKISYGTTLYVNPDATGNNSGLSWTNGFTSLQAAINSANAGDILFVKAGIYNPTQQIISGDNRSRSFYLNKNIKIYGGFNGTETTISERNVNANITILSGDFNGNDTDTNGNGINDFGLTENAYFVVLAYNLDNTALIDGFRITGGNADGTTSFTLGSYTVNTANGGGINNIASNLVVKNTRFINNSASFGGGITNKGACFPKIENCEFTYNFASYGNSVHANDASLITINNCVFSSNRGSGTLSSLNGSVQKVTNCVFSNNQGNSGCVLYNNNNCNAVFSNCIMRNNTASSSGGAIYNTNYGIVTMYNTLVYKNFAVYGGAVYNVSNSYLNSINCTYYGNNASTQGGAFYCSVSPDNMFMKMYNTIIYGNTSPSNPNWYKEFYTTSNIHVRNSIIQGSGGSNSWNTFYGTNDGNNLDTNPMFINTNQDVEDFRLNVLSPGIDASYNQLLNLPNSNNSWTSSDTDVYGNSRLVGSGVDIGAAENGDVLGVFENKNNKISFYIKNKHLFFEGYEDILNSEFQIIEITGKKVINGKIENSEINISILNKGIYVLKVDGYKGIKFLIN